MNNAMNACYKYLQTRITNLYHAFVLSDGGLDVKIRFLMCSFQYTVYFSR